jgi:hypothetical protein
VTRKVGGTWGVWDSEWLIKTKTLENKLKSDFIWKNVR